MKYDYHIIVIGAGSAGLVVAAGAASLGARVALIEGEEMGGDCLNWGCVPSKSFLRSAHIADYISKGYLYGLDSMPTRVNMKKVMDRVSAVIKSIEPHDSQERFESMGVAVIRGMGKIHDSHHVKVGENIHSARTIVLATGSSPYLPPLKGLSDVPFLTNKTVFKIDKLPDRLIVLGAGPIACELGQGFCHLGSKVTIINRSSQLFKKDEPEVASLMLERFIRDGMNMELGVKILEIRENSKKEIEVAIERDGIFTTIVGDRLLAALGRKPNTEGLDLEKNGIKTSDKGHIITNEKLQTSIPNIYACGDVTGPFAYTHTAGYQAGIVVQNAIFPLKRKTDYGAVPWVTYTKPEAAHVGYTEAQLAGKGKYYKKYMLPIKDNDRALTETATDGFLKILTDKRGTVIGATLVGEKAGEMISLASMAIVKKMRIIGFLSIIFPYPTETEIYRDLALEALKENFKPWQKNLVRKLFLRD